MIHCFISFEKGVCDNRKILKKKFIVPKLFDLNVTTVRIDTLGIYNISILCIDVHGGWYQSFEHHWTGGRGGSESDQF